MFWGKQHWIASACGIALAAFSTFDGAYAKSFKVLYAFEGGTDGNEPSGTLMSDKAGNLYGTTSLGGISGNCQNAGEECGDVFKIAPDGTETILYTFCALADCADGASPDAGLIEDSLGDLYGTTQFGGTVGCGGIGCGTVFKLAPDGTETVLHAFTQNKDGDGENPIGSLLADKSGNLYGTTEFGEGGGCRGFGCGTVFKVAPDGTERVLHVFNGIDGAAPDANLIADKAGNLYGTTSSGGKFDFGTVFKLARGDALTTLYSFTGNGDGSVPQSGLVLDKMGNLYGTTSMGAVINSFCSFGCGAIFKVAPDGTETTLYEFQGGKDGATPVAGLIFGKKGDLYGSTNEGGSDLNGGGGTIFRLTTAGVEKVLYRFCPQGNSCTEGAAPFGGLIMDRTGNLYGTAGLGGFYGSDDCVEVGCGTVWKLKD